MGLNERRLFADIKQNLWPSIESDIKAAAGFDVPIEVDWASYEQDPNIGGLASKRDPAAMAEFVKTVFGVVPAALHEVGRDEMGKEAIREKLKKVVFGWSENAWYRNNEYKHFRDGTLTYMQTATNLSEFDVYKKVVVDELEKGL